MDVDILIYVNNLKEFFKRDEQAFKDMFGTLEIDKELYFQKLTEIATKNFEQTGIPTLSTIQMFEIVKDLTVHTHFQDVLTTASEKEPKTRDKSKSIPPADLSKIFVHVKDGFPPICLN